MTPQGTGFTVTIFLDDRGPRAPPLVGNLPVAQSGAVRRIAQAQTAPRA